MHVISRKAIRRFLDDHPALAASAGPPLDRWYRLARHATWRNFGELRAAAPSADLAGACTVFDVGGNKYRVLAEIFYDDQVLLVRGVYTHREYDKLHL